MSWRRFLRGEGDDIKFWEIEVEGSSHKVRFGKLDMPGQIKQKRLASPKAANEAAEALIWKKRAEGYRESTDVAAPAAAPASASTTATKTAPAANAPVAAAPKKTTATRVTLTHPKHNGVLVLSLFEVRLVTREGSAAPVGQTFDSASAASEHFERVIAMRKKNGYVISTTEEIPPEEMEPKTEGKEGEEGDGSGDAGTSADVIDGFKIGLDGTRWTITFTASEDEVSKATCTKILERLAKDAPKTVQVICDFASPGASWASAIAKMKLPSVTSFIFDTHFQTQTRQGENTIGDLALTLGALPNCERFFATGSLEISPCKHDKLRELYMLGDPLTTELLEGLAQCELPRLERLVLSLASDSGPGPDAATTRALLGMRAPKLDEIYIDSLEDIAGTLSALGDERLRPSWKILSLEGSLDEDDLLQTLEEYASAFSSLEALALPFADEMSTDAEETAKKTLPNVRDREADADMRLPAIYTNW